MLSTVRMILFAIAAVFDVCAQYFCANVGKAGTLVFSLTASCVSSTAKGLASRL